MFLCVFLSVCVFVFSCFCVFVFVYFCVSVFLCFLCVCVFVVVGVFVLFLGVGYILNASMLNVVMVVAFCYQVKRTAVRGCVMVLSALQSGSAADERVSCLDVNRARRLVTRAAR